MIRTCEFLLARAQNEWISTKQIKNKKQKTKHHEDKVTLKSLSLDNFWFPADWMSFFCLKIGK